MIRRPRFPLILRLAWIESELRDAAALLPSIINDAVEVRRLASATNAKVLLVAHVVAAVLLPLGVDRERLAAFVEALGPDGDIERADEAAAELVAEVLLRMAETDGEAD